MVQLAGDEHFEPAVFTLRLICSAASTERRENQPRSFITLTDIQLHFLKVSAAALTCRDGDADTCARGLASH